MFQVNDNIATAKLVDSVWFDYFNVMRVSDAWQIINIIYEMPAA